MGKITLDLDELLKSGMNKEAILRDIENTIEKELNEKAKAAAKEQAMIDAYADAYDELLNYYEAVNGDGVPNKKREEASAFLDSFINPNVSYIKKRVETADKVTDLWDLLWK